MQTNETLIKNIWKKYSDKAPTKAQILAILKKAQASFVKAEKKYKLGTFVSWWTRQSITKKKSK